MRLFRIIMVTLLNTNKFKRLLRLKDFSWYTAFLHSDKFMWNQFGSDNRFFNMLPWGEVIFHLSHKPGKSKERWDFTIGVLFGRRTTITSHLVDLGERQVIKHLSGQFRTKQSISSLIKSEFDRKLEVIKTVPDYFLIGFGSRGQYTLWLCSDSGSFRVDARLPSISYSSFSLALVRSWNLMSPGSIVKTMVDGWKSVKNRAPQSLVNFSVVYKRKSDEFIYGPTICWKPKVVSKDAEPPNINHRKFVWYNGKFGFWRIFQMRLGIYYNFAGKFF